MPENKEKFTQNVLADYLKAMKKKIHYIDLDTGEIGKKYSEDRTNYLVTYGYRNAQTVARLIKKDDPEGALTVANRGIEEEPK